MGLKSDNWIDRAALNGMLRPYVDHLVRYEKHKPVISYGLSSCGYDIRLDRQFKVFTPTRQPIVDPKNFDPACVDDHEGDFCIIPPNSFALARAMETFHVPDNVLCIAIGKSSYARCGVVTNITPFEPGWIGVPTLEISNTGPLPAKVYAGEGICQVLFFEADDAPSITYAGRSGKYQHQTNIQLPKM